MIAIKTRIKCEKVISLGYVPGPGQYQLEFYTEFTEDLSSISVNDKLIASARLKRHNNYYVANVEAVDNSAKFITVSVDSATHFNNTEFMIPETNFYIIVHAGQLETADTNRQAFYDTLNENTESLIVLVDVDVYNPTTDATETLPLSNHPFLTSNTDTPANQLYFDVLATEQLVLTEDLNIFDVNSNNLEFSTDQTDLEMMMDSMTHIS